MARSGESSPPSHERGQRRGAGRRGLRADILRAISFMRGRTSQPFAFQGALVTTGGSALRPQRHRSHGPATNLPPLPLTSTPSPLNNIPVQERGPRRQDSPVSSAASGRGLESPIVGRGPSDGLWAAASAAVPLRDRTAFARRDNAEVPPPAPGDSIPATVTVLSQPLEASPPQPAPGLDRVRAALRRHRVPGGACPGKGVAAARGARGAAWSLLDDPSSGEEEVDRLLRGARGRRDASTFRRFEFLPPEAALASPGPSALLGPLHSQPSLDSGAVAVRTPLEEWLASGSELGDPTWVGRGASGSLGGPVQGVPRGGFGAGGLLGETRLGNPGAGESE